MQACKPSFIRSILQPALVSFVSSSVACRGQTVTGWQDVGDFVNAAAWEGHTGLHELITPAWAEYTTVTWQITAGGPPERLTKGEDGSSAEPPGRSTRVGLGLASGLGAALENADSWPRGFTCIAAPRGLSCTTAPSPRFILAKEAGESAIVSCRWPVAHRHCDHACTSLVLSHKLGERALQGGNETS